MENINQQEILTRITEWLESIGKSREWFADQIGVSFGTVNGWYSKATNRAIPKPNIKLIEHLLKNNELGEPKFTFQESISIQNAMRKADYISFPEFSHDAVMAETDRILAEENTVKFPSEAPNKAADDGIKSATMPPQDPNTKYSTPKKPKK